MSHLRNGQYLVLCGTVVVMLSALLLVTLAADLKKDLVLHASFNQSVDAEVSGGDRKLYSAPDYKQLAAAKAGLAGTTVAHEKGALRFKEKNTKAVYFKADGMSSTSGTISFYLQLDPNLDLAPGYTDPLQLTDRDYNDSALWVDFTRDDKPRHFRLGTFGVLKSWNPQDLAPDKNPAFNQRLVIVKQPPFARGRWTHVVITYDKLGSGNGVSKLYLDGKLQGASGVVKEPFQWAPRQATLRLGVNYTGLLDEIRVYKRALDAGEVAQLGRESTPSAQ